jgi:hypothetical protein
VYAFGDASFHGAATGMARSAIVGIAPTATGDGYWLAARDGTVFGFGRAATTTASPIPSPGIVGIAATSTGNGFWLVGRDGGVFAFGDAPFAGSLASTTLTQPVVGIAAPPRGPGYWLAAQDGGVFALGGAPFLGSASSIDLGARHVVAIAAHRTGAGYWTAAATGPSTSGAGVVAIGDSVMLGARGALQSTIPEILVDAEVSRSFGVVPGIVAAYRDRGALGPAVVIHLGTNGPVSGTDIDRVMQVADGRHVVFVNIRVPRSWEGQSNAAIAEGVARWPNAVIADWRSVSAQDGMLARDGYHVTPAGATAYASVVAATL